MTLECGLMKRKEWLNQYIYRLWPPKPTTVPLGHQWPNQPRYLTHNPPPKCASLLGREETHTRVARSNENILQCFCTDVHSYSTPWWHMKMHWSIKLCWLLDMFPCVPIGWHNSSMSRQMRSGSHLEDVGVFITHRSPMDEQRQSHSCHYWISLMTIISCHFLSDSASAAWRKCEKNLIISWVIN